MECDVLLVSTTILKVGVGMSMEGIEQNPIVCDLMSEMAFHHRRVDLQVWVETYPTRRYGKPVKGLQDAWWILYHTLYNCTNVKLGWWFVVLTRLTW